MAKNLILKYAWLIETIYNSKGITFKELSEKWSDNDLSEGNPLALRTFHKWCDAAAEVFGVTIECERKGGYHYTIANEEDITKGGLRTWLLQTVSVSNLLMANQSMKNRILLENIPSGRNHLSFILEAMKTSTAITVTYQSFWRENEYATTLYPYCVKMFKQRWYMLAECPYSETTKVRIYALDRIHAISHLPNEKFQLPQGFSAEEFFENVYGIIVRDKDVQSVKLKVAGSEANYIRSLPLHKTQKEIEKTDEYSIFELRIAPEFDFQQELLSHTPDIEVLEPTWLREEIALKVKILNDKYNN